MEGYKPCKRQNLNFWDNFAICLGGLSKKMLPLPTKF